MSKTKSSPVKTIEDLEAQLAEAEQDLAANVAPGRAKVDQLRAELDRLQVSEAADRQNRASEWELRFLDRYEESLAAGREAQEAAWRALWEDLRSQPWVRAYAEWRGIRYYHQQLSIFAARLAREHGRPAVHETIEVRDFDLLSNLAAELERAAQARGAELFAEVEDEHDAL
jgi:hypothetical protein